jgi:hypothetical protein
LGIGLDWEIGDLGLWGFGGMMGAYKYIYIWNIMGKKY